MRYVFLGWVFPVLLFTAGCRSDLSPQDLADAEYLVEHGTRLFHEGKGTLYEYATNSICRNDDAMRIFKGRQSGDLAAAVRRLAECRRRIQRGMEWRIVLPEKKIPRMKHSPVPDGRISEQELEECLLFRGEYPLDAASRNRAFADSLWLLGWKEDFLYLAVSFRDDDPEIYHGKKECADGKYLYLGDCLEFFVRPQLEKTQYFECLINGAGDFWMLSHIPGYWGGFTSVDRECSAPGARIGGTWRNGCFILEAVLPFRIWHGEWCARPPRPGDRFSFMMLRANRRKSEYGFSTPVPFLFGGHNLYGYLHGVLVHDSAAELRDGTPGGRIPGALLR